MDLKPGTLRIPLVKTVCPEAGMSGGQSIATQPHLQLPEHPWPGPHSPWQAQVHTMLKQARCEDEDMGSMGLTGVPIEVCQQGQTTYPCMGSLLLASPFQEAAPPWTSCSEPVSPQVMHP